MFNKQKPVIKVISVKSEKRHFKDKSIDYRSSNAHGPRGYVDRKEDIKEYSHSVTTVLITKNGELMTKEFNGKWDLSDVKAWEDEN